MEVKQILQAQVDRRSRIGRPFSIFSDTLKQCKEAGEAALAGKVASEYVLLLERSLVISTVTAVEVYYRDMLDFIFRYCSKDYFMPHLKHLCPEKFDILEMVDVYLHRLHPLEIVSASQSFQNAERIDKVFSKFLGQGLWDTVMNLQVRLKDDPSTEVSWGPELLEGMKRLFLLRHELVHDPAKKTFFSKEVLSDVLCVEVMVFGSDIVIANDIVRNKDPDLVIPESAES